ncbi:MAG: deoxyribonuclease [Pseudonocardiales bacterium]|nr:deoxyribonuclease [Pseudonocardiales bacterium]
MPRPRASLIGAHLSVAGGLPRCLSRVDLVGAEVVQLFLASPRAWATPPADPDSDESFRASCAGRSLPVFVHAPYLLNFGSPSAQTLDRSASALEFSLRRGGAIGALGVVMHAGNAVLGNDRDAAMKQLRESVLRVLDRVPNGPALLIEPTAGGGLALASDAESLAGYLDILDRDERIGVCLDTCHMHAAGYDLSTVRGFGAALRAYGRAAGSNRVQLVHVNDSRDPVGSKRDRHAAIGAGTIGAEPFAALFSSPVTRGVPLVVESTDLEHAADIAALKQLRGDRLAARQ